MLFDPFVNDHPRRLSAAKTVGILLGILAKTVRETQDSASTRTDGKLLNRRKQPSWEDGRGAEIRTPDLLVPNQKTTHYQ